MTCDTLKRFLARRWVSAIEGKDCKDFYDSFYRCGACSNLKASRRTRWKRVAQRPTGESVYTPGREQTGSDTLSSAHGEWSVHRSRHVENRHQYDFCES